LSNSLQSISNNAIDSLKNFTVKYNEQWKYTNLNHYTKFNLSLVDNYSKVDINYSNNREVTIINNIIQNDINKSNITSLPLDKAFNDNVNNCSKIFNTIIPQDKNHFTLYNTAYFKNGNYFHFDKNTSLKSPLYINNILNQSDPKAFLHNRFLFHFGKSFSGTIVIKELYPSNQISNTVYELYLEENVNVEFIIESVKPETIQIMNFGAIIEDNATLKINSIDISGHLLKNNYFINLNGKNSQCSYNGLSLLNNNNHIDNYIEMNHNNKNTISHAHHKNILTDESIGIFYPKSTINRNSSNSEAYQKNNNLLLSKKAVIHSNPQLMIFNDDVQCSHGSTTGQIDDDALFYLRSRGINLQNAQKMLLNAFLNENIDTINDIIVKEDIKIKVNSWIKKHVNN